MIDSRVTSVKPIINHVERNTMVEELFVGVMENMPVIERIVLHAAALQHSSSTAFLLQRCFIPHPYLSCKVFIDIFVR